MEEVRDPKNRLIAKCDPQHRVEIKDSKKRIIWDIDKQILTVSYKGDTEETIFYNDGSQERKEILYE